MSGWKTYAGAAVIAAGAIVRWLGYTEIADGIMMLGGALGLVGVGHKLQRSLNGEKK